MLVLVAMVAAIAWSPTVSAQQFSEPILIGGDDDTSTTAAEQTDAINLHFFVHPETAVENFSDDTGKIQPDDYDASFIDDVGASPGHARTDETVQADSAMIEQLTERTTSGSPISPLNGLGPDDLKLKMIVTNPSPPPVDWEFDWTLGLDLRLHPTGRNKESHRFIMGDVRASESGEWGSIFSSSWLEDYLFGGSTLPIIGNAKDVAPYDGGKYPATVINRGVDPAPFRWCVKLPEAGGPFRGYLGCDASSNPQLSKNEYTEVFLYDFADIGNGIVATSYDPLALKVVGEGFLSLFVDTVAAGEVAIALSPPWLEEYAYAYFSPLTLFRKEITTSAEPRYRLTGYTSWYMPDIDITSGLEISDLWQLIVTNWMLPFATNPVGIEAIDLNGASSPVGDSKDTDLAVSYQTTLFDLDANFFDPFGRPAMGGDWTDFILHRKVWGTCTTPCSSADFKTLTDDITSPNTFFPDNVVSLMLFWKQRNKWFDGGMATTKYVNENPSHVFAPMGHLSDDPDQVRNGGGIVGPGVYDIAVITDNDADPTTRRQYVVVPSEDVVADALGNMKSPIYIIDPDEGENLWLRVPKAVVSGTADCVGTEVFRKTPLVVPSVHLLERPPSLGGEGFVPYKIRSGNIDGDSCEDLIVTWRGRATKVDPDDTVSDHPYLVVFSDGTERMFSNRVTILLRSENLLGQCDFTPEADYGPFPKYIEVPDITNPSGMAVVASADIGDLNGDGGNDIVAGNLAAEGENAYATIYWNGPSSIWPNPSATFNGTEAMRVRMNFHSSPETVGVGVVRADQGKQAIAAINGRPLMLPKIGCPENMSLATDTVGSVFETYRSINKNLASKWLMTGTTGLFGVMFPFVDSGDSPVPTRCADTPDFCTVSGYNLPLYESDPCCQPLCTETVYTTWTASDCYAYLKLYDNYSCEVYNYLKEYNDTCTWVSLPPDDIDELNRGLASWQPDQVVGDDDGAIISAAALEQAQTNPQAGSAKANLPGAAGKAPGLLKHIHMPLEAIILSSLDNLAKGDPRMAENVDRMRESRQLADLEKRFNEYFHESMFGPAKDVPAALGMGDSMTAILLSVDSVAKSKEDRSAKSSVFGRSCSLVAHEPGIDLSALSEKIKVAARWVWDLIVPDADAATCGDFTIEGTETCDGLQICKKGGAGGCTAAGYVCHRPGTPVGSAHECRCYRNGCGDGCLSPGEACDPTAVPQGSAPWATGDGFYTPATSYGCSTGTCQSDCTCSTSITGISTPPTDVVVATPVCGNNVIQTGEDCDEPATWMQINPSSPCYPNKMVCRDPTDFPPGCYCRPPICGDGTKQVGTWADATTYVEPCDPDADPPDNECPGGTPCPSTCVCPAELTTPDIGLTPVCGNGVVNTGEDCDPAATSAPDNMCPDGVTPCPSTCSCLPVLGPICGNDTINTGETCDGTALNPDCDSLGNPCRAADPDKCTCCGDSIVQSPTEECDPAFSPICGTGTMCQPDCTCGGSSSGTCGDGTIDPGEQCDSPPPDPCLLMSLVCNPLTCMCINPTCGDGVLAGGEECEAPGWTCADPDETCLPSLCECVNLKAVKLPWGQLMPGRREMTAVLLMHELGTSGGPDCGNDIVNPGEQCDTLLWPDHTLLPTPSLYMTTVDSQCQASVGPPPSGHIWYDCTTACYCASAAQNCLDLPLSDPAVDCHIDSECGVLGAFCNSSCHCVEPDENCLMFPVPPNCHDNTDCAAGQYCYAGDCLCHDIPPGAEITEDAPGMDDLLASTTNDCEVTCGSFSSDAVAEHYKEWNDEVRSWSGRTDDLFCEPEQKVTVTCRIGAGAATDASAVATLSASSAPLEGTTILPYMYIQTSGSEFIDIATQEFKDPHPVEAPMRILPVEGVDPATQTVKSIVLPDLSAGLTGLEGVAPLATSSVAYGAGDVIMVNNMIEHRAFTVVPGEDYTVIVDGSAQTIKAEAVDIATGAAILILETQFTMPPDYASWTGVKGYKGTKLIEDKQLDADAVKAAIEAGKAAFEGVPTSAIYTDLPWEQNLNYSFSVIQSVYGPGDMAAPSPAELQFAFLGGFPAVGRGGGCGCFMADGNVSLGSIAPFFLVILLPAGIAVGAARRRMRK